MTNGEKAELLKWLRTAIELGKGAEGVANTFRLVKKGEMGHEEVDAWTRPFPELKTFVNEIDAAIKLSAKGDDESVVTYKVLPLYGTNTEPIGAFPVQNQNQNIYSSDAELATNFGGENSISPKGMLKSNQGHLERVMNIALKTSELQMRSFASQLASQQDEIVALRAERERLYLLHQDSLDRKQEREIKAAQAIARQQMMLEAVKGIMPFVPFIVDKIQGKGQEGKELPPDLRLMIEQARATFGNMEPEQIQQIAAMMGPAGIPFTDFAMKFMHEKLQGRQMIAEQIKALVPDHVAPKLPEPAVGAPYKALGE